MVISKSVSLKWDVPNQSTTSVSATNQSVTNRPGGGGGGGTTGKVYQRDSDMSGDDVAYQRSRNSGSEVCFPNLSQGSKFNLSSYLNGQSGSFDLPKKNRRCKE